MNKKTQMYLGVAALGVVAYLVYKNNTKKGFANSGSMLNASGRGIFAPTGGVSNSTFRTAPKPKCKNGLYATYNTNGLGQVTSTEFHDCQTGVVTGSSLGQVTL
jgi:hypothetical protein